jgi:hypothetical protein
MDGLTVLYISISGGHYDFSGSIILSDNETVKDYVMKKFDIDSDELQEMQITTMKSNLESTMVKDISVADFMKIQEYMHNLLLDKISIRDKR